MAGENNDNTENKEQLLPGETQEQMAQRILLKGLNTTAESVNENTEQVKETIKSLGKIETEESKKQREGEAAFNEISNMHNLEYRDVFPDAIPSKGDYYEKGRTYSIRACRTEEIKHYSGMRENDIYDVEQKVNEIIDSCTKVKMGNGKLGSYKDLSLYDKIFFLFAIRDFTLTKKGQENKMFHIAEHPKTGEKMKVEIDKDCFDYYQITNGISKWYDEEERAFVIKSPSLGSPLVLRIPTIGVTEAIRDYVRIKEEKKRRGENAYYDEQFLMYSQFLIKDWREIGKKEEEMDAYFGMLFDDYKKWNEDKHMTMAKAAAKLDYGVKPTVIVDFEKGGRTNSPITFPNYRSLFDFSSVSDELLQD